MAGEIEVNVNQNNNQVNLTQNVTNIVEVKSLGPKGDKGDKGETGATGLVYEPTGSLFITGSINISGSINLVSGSLNVEGMTYPTTDGDRGDILTTDGSGNITFDRTRIYAQIKNISGTTLQKGTPVHVVSSVGNLDEVIAASASNPSTMPATFVLSETLTDDQEGLGILSGFINGIDTSQFSEGDVVYVAANGGYTNQKPSGSNLIQNLGIVTKVAVNGSGFIYGSGRSNDTPNLLQSHIFFGSSSNQQYQTHLSSAIDLTTLNNVTASGNISSSGTVYGVTGSFSHLVGNSPITVGSPVTFTQVITGSVFSGSFVGDGSGLTGISGGGGSGIFTATGSFQSTTNDLQITGSVFINDTTTNSGSGEENVVFKTDATAGRLFTLTNDLSDEVFTVNDISGITVFKVSGSGEVLLKDLPTNEPNITGSLWISGSSPAHPSSGYLMIFKG